MLAVAAGFVAAGIFLVIVGQAAVGWMSLTLSGACGAVFVRQLLDSRPRLVIDDHGIMDRTLGVGVIPWGDIQGAYVKTIYGNDFICLELRDPQLFVSRLGAVHRATQAANRPLGFTELSLNLSGVQVPTEAVLELILMKSGNSTA